VAHEVIKRVGRRAYRYRVESRRDSVSGKLRPHWTYLGVAGEADASGTSASRPVRRASGATRSQLLDAFERIAERERYAAITAGAVAAEAGVAHGTFYRYFRDKRDLLTSALERVREDLARIAPSFDPPFGDAGAERLRVRAWLTAIFAKPADHPGVLRAFYEALEGDAELRASAGERRRDRVTALTAYLSSLSAEGTIAVVRPEPLATALLALVDATFRAEIVARESARMASSVAGAIDVFDRAIFAVSPGPSPDDATVTVAKGVESATSVAAAGISAIETRAPLS
jgi:AcrR family transcriptional regulator